MATLLEAQGDENVFRIAAYRRAAARVAALPESVSALYEQAGLPGLDALPDIGPGIAVAIGEIVQTGHWARLDRLRGAADAETLFRTIPGVGPALALRMHDELGVDSLEELEAAAHDGRLSQLPNLGVRRAQAIAAALTQMLDRARATRRRSSSMPEDRQPPVETLLEVDREYRAAAAAGRLQTIAPRRFNPQAQSWLPVMHAQRGEWNLTALFSNTARAHELGRVRDWVVLYAEDSAHRERQYTVVSAERGPLAGERVVRGREDECRTLYEEHRTAPGQREA